MIIRDEGIVFKLIKYGDTSLIVHMFLRSGGMRPLIVSGVRKSNNQGRAALFQIGHLLEVTYYDKNRPGIRRLKECQLAIPLLDNTSHIMKIALSQYFVELSKNSILHEATADDELYLWLRDHLIHLNDLIDIPDLFALRYLWGLIDILGFLPDDNSDAANYSIHTAVDLMSTLSVDDRTLMKRLIRHDIHQLHDFDSYVGKRSGLMLTGHQYLKNNLHYFKIPGSLDIFRDILLGR